MRNAYALLGLTFIIVFGSVYILFRQSVEAPSETDDSTFEATVNQNETMSLSLTSSVFSSGSRIPSKYTCDGDNINPPLSIVGVPEGTKALALVMDDPDIPEAVKESRGIEKFDHWVLYNIPADTTNLPEGIVPGQIGMEGQNSVGVGYTGPCPPADLEPTTHRYIFRLYALSEELAFREPPTVDELERATQGILLDSAELIGVYSRE